MLPKGKVEITLSPHPFLKFTKSIRMEITFNSVKKQIEDNASIQLIINDFIGEKQKGIAVAVNEMIVPKSAWENHILKPHDEVLVVKATQGG